MAWDCLFFNRFFVLTFTVSAIIKVLEVATNEPDPELETVARPATESLFHIQRVAEGMFDLSRGKNREDRAPENHFNRYAASVGLINGRKPDAFDVSG